jgi:hypothetical protein
MNEISYSSIFNNNQVVLMYEENEDFEYKLD